MKKLDQILNILMGAFIGVFLGHGLWQYWNYHRYPDLYAMQSAPWYTSILVYGAFAAGVVIIALLLKWILGKASQKRKGREEDGHGIQ